jgi:hypothetical protein
VRHVGELEQIRSERTKRKPAGHRLELAAHHHETLAGVSRERGGRGKKRGGDNGRLYRPWDFTTEKGGRNFPFSRASPPRPPATGANRPKIARPAPRGTKPSSYSGKWCMRGARWRGCFASSGPGRGRGKGGQTRNWAPRSAAAPTGHPFKHAQRGFDRLEER